MKRSLFSPLSQVPLSGVCFALVLAGLLPLGSTAQASPLLPGTLLVRSTAALVVAADKNSDKDQDPNNDPDYLYLQAIVDQSQGGADPRRYKQAINLYNQALKKRNGFSDAIYNRAICNYYLKKYDDSIKDSTTHIGLRPNIMQAYVIRARAYVKLRTFDPALTDLNLVEQRRPDLMDYRLRGRIYLETQNYPKAIPDFKKFVEINRGKAEAIPVYLDLGDVYAKTNDTDDSIKAYGEYIVNYDSMIKQLPQLKGDEEQDNLPYALDKRGSAYLDQALKANDPKSPLLDGAESDYNKYVAVKPQSAIGYVGLGNVYILRGDKDKAIQELDIALQKEPGNESAQFARAHLSRLIGAGDATPVAEKAADTQNAIAGFNTILAADPKNAKALYERGLAYSSPSSGNYAGAAADFTSYLAIAAPDDPNRAYVYFNRGVAYESMTPPQYDKAIPDFDAAILADPKNTAAYVGRGDAYAKQGIFDKAVADYNVVINGGSDIDDGAKINAHFNRAVAYSKMQPPRTDEAIADLTTYLQTNGKDQAAKDLLFNLQLSQGPEKQLAALNDRITADPTNSDLYLKRAAVYDGLKRYDDAIADYTKVVAAKPDTVAAYENLAADYTAKGLDDPTNIDGAIAADTKLIALAPTNENYVQARGDLYLKKKQYGDAATDYKKAITELPANDPKRPDIQYLVANLYLVSGNKAVAKTEYDTYFTIATPAQANYANALAEHGDLLRGTKDYPGAIADYTKFLAIKTGDAKVLKVRGQTYVDSGDPVKGLADYEAAVAVAPTDPEALTLAAQIYYNQAAKAAESDPDKAIPLYKKAIANTDQAITSDQKYAFAYFYKGYSLAEDAEIDNLTPEQQKGMRSDALTALKKFVELSPDDPQAANAGKLIAKLQKLVGA